MGLTVQAKARIEHRRMQVSEMYLKGWMQSAIARELGVSQSTVSGDLKALRKEWMKARIHDTDSLITEEVKHLQLIGREAWAAWQGSMQPQETTRLVQKNGEKKVEKTIRQRSGDPRLLKLAHGAHEKICSLLGLDAKFRVNGEKKPFLSWDELFAEAAREPDRLELLEKEIADLESSKSKVKRLRRRKKVLIRKNSSSLNG